MDNLPRPHEHVSDVLHRTAWWCGRHRVPRLLQLLRRDFRILSLTQITDNARRPSWSKARATKRLNALVRDGVLFSGSSDGPERMFTESLTPTSMNPLVILQPGESFEANGVSLQKTDPSIMGPESGGLPLLVECVFAMARLDSSLRLLDVLYRRSFHWTPLVSRTVYAASKEALDFALTRVGGVDEELGIFRMCQSWLQLTWFQPGSVPSGEWRLNPRSPDSPEAITPDVLIVHPEDGPVAAMDVGRPWYTAAHLRGLKSYCDERSLVLVIW